MVHVVVSAREDVIVESTASPLKPGEQGLPSWFDDLKLHRSLRLLLDHDRTVADVTAGDDVTDTNLDDVTPSKLAINREIEEGAVAQASMMVEPETYRPYLLRLKRALGSQ